MVRLLLNAPIWAKAFAASVVLLLCLVGLGTTAYLKRELKALPADERYAYRVKQGVPAPFVEVRAMTDDGCAPQNGTTMGELQVRGPWIAASYYRLAAEARPPAGSRAPTCHGPAAKYG